MVGPNPLPELLPFIAHDQKDERKYWNENLARYIDFSTVHVCYGGSVGRYATWPLTDLWYSRADMDAENQPDERGSVLIVNDSKQIGEGYICGRGLQEFNCKPACTFSHFSSPLAEVGDRTPLGIRVDHHEWYRDVCPCLCNISLDGEPHDLRFWGPLDSEF